MASCDIRMDSSSGKSTRSLLAICSGLHEAAHRRSCRRPRRRPTQRTFGPGTAAPSGAAIRPPRRSCTYCLSSPFAASLATFGRFARRSACHWAVVARYSRFPLRVAAFRRSSREIVDDERRMRLSVSVKSAPVKRSSKWCTTSSESSGRTFWLSLETLWLLLLPIRSPGRQFLRISVDTVIRQQFQFALP